MQQRVSTMIKGLTGRQVAAFMSASHQDPDLTVELFVLEPKVEDSEQPLAAEDQSLEREP